MASKVKLWIFTLLAILAFGLAFVMTLKGSEQALLDQARRRLQTTAEEKAQLISAWRTNLSNSMIALAEQREIRETIAKISSGQIDPNWRAGFISACDASFRAFQITNPALENLSLRSLNGAKLAGSGPAAEDISYPNLRERVRQVPLSPLKEQWILPVRDPQAQPLAYVAAEVNLQQSLKAILASGSPADLLLCLEDSSGHRIWNSSDSLRIPPLKPSTKQLELGRDEAYLLAHTTVPGTEWTLGLARGKANILSEYEAGKGQLILFAVGAIAAVLILRITLFRRM